MHRKLLFRAQRIHRHDRTTEPEDNIDFENAWGVSDEDLYEWVIAAVDQAVSDDNPFYDFVMTTSNHRPYTYPDDRIDIPSRSGRDGAVKYRVLGNRLARWHDRLRSSLLHYRVPVPADRNQIRE